MRITLVIFSLSHGGAERVMSTLANYWAAKCWNVTMLTFDNGELPPFYELKSEIHHRSLGIAKDSPNLLIGIWLNLKRIWLLRGAIRNSKPDAVISFMDTTNIVTLLATRGLKVPVIVSERIDPAMHSIGRIWERLRRWTYPFADRVVVQSKGALAYFSSKQQSRACILPNPVSLPMKPEQKSDKLSIGQFPAKDARRSLVGMGRLTRQKGFDLLLQAFARLKDSHPEWTLTILGEGELRAELESLCNSLGLSDLVDFPGVVKNPYKILQQADIFVMSSRFEGFPNALCEAMACGLPVISTDCPSGPREIIRDGIDGILVPNENVDALAAGMNRLMSDEQERKRLSARATEVLERFSLENVMEMWEEVLNQVFQEKLSRALAK